MWVVDAAIGITLEFRAGAAANLAVVVKTRPDGAEGYFGLAQLMTSVTVPARGRLGVVGILFAHTGLRDAFTLLPIAHQLAVGRILDRG